MTANSCSLTCNVKTPDGKVKVSALWEELHRFFEGDRRQSVTHYFLTKDSNFLRENSNVLEFDVNGEVTIASLKKALENGGEYTNLSNARTLAHLNRELKAGKYDYSEALDNVLKFNKSNQFRDGFMATLKKEEDGKYSISVVERNANAEYELAAHVQNKILADALRLILADKGLSVEFLDNPSFAVQYNTHNLHLDMEGLYAVASVLDGVNTGAEIAEVAGHFIVAAMENNPMVQNLIRQLTPEVQRAIFADNKSDLHREDFLVAQSSAREAAGILVGKALIKSFNTVQKKSTSAASIGTAIPRAIKWLANKVAAIARRIFKAYKPDPIKKLIQDAQNSASTVAEGFISSPEAADPNVALAADNVYKGISLAKKMADDVRRNVRAYYETLGSLKDIVAHLHDSVMRADNVLNKNIYDNLSALTQEVSAKYNTQVQIAALADKASIEGIVVALTGITRVLDNDVRNLLEQIQPANRNIAIPQVAVYAKNLNTVNNAVKNIATLYDIISAKIDSLKAKETVSYMDSNDVRVVDTLRDAVKRLGDVLLGNEETYEDLQGESISVRGLQGLLEAKRRQVWADAVRAFYGQDYIEMSAGIVFEQRGWHLPRLIKTQDRRVAVRDFADSLESDISWFDRFMGAAADCADFITAVGDKQVKQANLSADRLASMFWDRLEESRLQMQDLFGSTDWTPFMEMVDVVDENGRIIGKEKTGNFVQELNYGAWEQERERFKQKLKEEWVEYLKDMRDKYYANNKGTAFSLSDQVKGVLYHKFVDAKWKKWHAQNSDVVKTSKGNVYKPSKTKYYNPQYDALFGNGVERSKQKRVWYETFNQIKVDMDSLLPKNATVPWRAPQITGRYSHRFRSLRAKMNNSVAAFGHAIRMGAENSLFINPNDAWMFGSNNEFNEVQEDPLENEMYFQREKLDRIPLYGINKLKDMNNLSLDIFGTMMSYGSMAASYHAMESIVDIFELGKETLKERRIKNKGNKPEKDLEKGQSRAYARYLKFVEKKVYGINVESFKWDRRGFVTKLANNLSSLGSRILLWGNAHGGVVNTGTGVFEILKEALAGENFTADEVGKALQMYYSGFFTASGYGGTFSNMITNIQRPEDKNSLWIRHWNILSENRRFLRGQQYDSNARSLLDNRLWEWFGHTLMLPYSSGDHFMQTIPYYAMGYHTKVYDHDGNKMSLIDAYEIVDGKDIKNIEGDEVLGQNHKKLRLKGQIFKNAEDIDAYDTVQKMLERIDNLFLNNPNIKDNAPVNPELFNAEEKEYLADNGLTIPTTAGQLSDLKYALKDSASKLLYNEEDESAFMDKCRNICNRLHGIYNTEDKVCFQQDFYGNLLLAMRGYALGMVNRRFASSSFNVPQGKVVEGSYNTAFKILLSAFYNLDNADNWKAVGESMFLMMPLGNLALFSSKYGEKMMADMRRAGFSKHQYYNMRRTSADFLVLEALFLMNFLTAPGRHFGVEGEDDDKESNDDSFVAGLIYYFTMRWFNEQGAFTWPTAMFNESTQLLDYVPAGFSGMIAIYDIAELFLRTQADKADGEPNYDNSELYYQTSKEGKYEVGDAKWWKKFKSLAPYYRSYYLMQRPYEAASSYEYGRRVRGR